MSQSTEQNVFRSRDEQVADSFSDPSYMATCFTKDGFIRALEEAEARGAAEERAKAVEGHVPCGHLITEHETGKVTFNKHPVSPEDMREYELTSETVYTRPANVAALEARVKELEGVCRHVVWTVEEYGLGSRGHDSAVQVARAALTREGGV